MKKFFYTIIFSLSVSAVFAQGIGLKAGVNFANTVYEAGGLSFSPSSITGFHVGAVAEVGLTDALYLSPGIIFITKGDKIEMEMDGIIDDMKSQVGYLEIPIDLQYKFDLGVTKFFVKAGPYLGYAISGKSKFGDIEGDIEFGSEDGETKRMDFGANIGAGLDISALQFSLNYGIGLSNIQNSSDLTVKNKCFAISVGYFIGR